MSVNRLKEKLFFFMGLQLTIFKEDLTIIQSSHKTVSDLNCIFRDVLDKEFIYL